MKRRQTTLPHFFSLKRPCASEQNPDLLSALPAELKVMLVYLLREGDALRLRLASGAWKRLVDHHPRWTWREVWVNLPDCPNYRAESEVYHSEGWQCPFDRYFSLNRRQEKKLRVFEGLRREEFHGIDLPLAKFYRLEGTVSWPQALMYYRQCQSCRLSFCVPIVGSIETDEIVHLGFLNPPDYLMDNIRKVADLGMPSTLWNGVRRKELYIVSQPGKEPIFFPDVQRILVDLPFYCSEKCTRHKGRYFWHP